MRAKTTVYLDPRQAKLLALIAGDRKTTQAELIRQAIDQLIESTALPLPSFVGMGESVDDTVSAANVKDWIRENWPKDYEAKLARNRVTPPAQSA
jgi:hypothetical protein